MSNISWSSKKLFSFYLGMDELSEQFEQCLRFGKFKFQADGKTPIHQCTDGEREILIFGYAIDLESGESDAALTQSLLDQTNTIDSLIMRESNLGGKYLIFYRENDKYFVIPDATSSIPLFYTLSSVRTIVTSHSQLIVNSLGLTPDKDLLKIRKSGDISQAMPYDITEFAEIKQLIPNHYLDIASSRSKRFVNCSVGQNLLTPEEAANLTAPKILMLAEYYMSKFKIYCPITGGKDSRVVLASLVNLSGTHVDAYTIRHSTHTGNESDLTSPPKLAEKTGINYNQVTDIPPEGSLVEAFDKMLGTGRYSQRTLMIANTVNKNFGDGCIINGDIIGQVGKCSLHRDIPIRLATAGYFRCKLHNYSKGSKKMLKKWLCEIKESGEGVNCFDLFSVESRMGRWAAQENTIYNSIGQVYLNIFNSRSIIYVWTAVDRGLRKNSAIHTALIEKISPCLLEVPFDNSSSIINRLCKSGKMTYYFSSFFKFYYEGSRFKIGHFKFLNRN